MIFEYILTNFFRGLVLIISWFFKLLLCLYSLVVQQWPYEAAAIAFEAIPRTLAQNCGVNVIRTMTALQGKVWMFLECSYMLLKIPLPLPFQFLFSHIVIVACKWWKCMDWHRWEHWCHCWHERAKGMMKFVLFL